MRYLRSRTDLLQMLPKGMIIAELGVFRGEFSDEILKISEPKELHLIDIWKGKMCSADTENENMVYIDDMEVVYNELVEKYKTYPNVTLHRGSTLEVLKTFLDDYFDFIYIDADHTFNSVLNDLRMAFSKSSRYIGGHDFCSIHLQVMAGVAQFMAESGTRIVVLTRNVLPSYLFDKEWP